MGGALCFAAGIPFLLVILSGLMGFIAMGLETDWMEAVTYEMRHGTMVVLFALCVVCLFTLTNAGHAFWTQELDRGPRMLTYFLISGLILVILVFLNPQF